MAALGVFGLCQILAFVNYLQANMSPASFNVLFRGVMTIGLTAAGEF